MSISYTTQGNVRGNCGHKHRTLRGALKCIESDRRGCRDQGGYSDRTKILASDGTTYLAVESDIGLVAERDPDEVEAEELVRAHFEGDDRGRK